MASTNNKKHFGGSGSAKQISWLEGLSNEQRDADFSTVIKLKNNPGLLDEFARIPWAVYEKKADGNFVECHRKQPIAEAVEDSE